MRKTLGCRNFDLVAKYAFSQAPSCTNFTPPGSASDSRTGDRRIAAKKEEAGWAGKRHEAGGVQAEHIFLDSHLFTDCLPASTLTLLHRGFN